MSFVNVKFNIQTLTVISNDKKRFQIKRYILNIKYINKNLALAKKKKSSSTKLDNKYLPCKLSKT